jgi:Fe-S-cluster-containing hydrogenase component 2
MAAVVDQEKCTGCAKCVDACPTQAVSMVDEKAVVKEDDCADCAACVDACESGAMAMP